MTLPCRARATGPVARPSDPRDQREQPHGAGQTQDSRHHAGPHRPSTALLSKQQSGPRGWWPQDPCTSELEHHHCGVLGPWMVPGGVEGGAREEWAVALPPALDTRKLLLASQAVKAAMGSSS